MDCVTATVTAADPGDTPADIAAAAAAAASTQAAPCTCSVAPLIWLLVVQVGDIMLGLTCMYRRGL